MQEVGKREWVSARDHTQKKTYINKKKTFIYMYNIDLVAVNGEQTKWKTMRWRKKNEKEKSK